MQAVSAVVWSQDNCQYCDMAKALLKSKGFDVTEKVIGKVFTKKDLLEAVPAARSVPQIFIDGVLIPGGYNGLKNHLGGAIA